MSCTNTDATAQALADDIIRQADALDRSILEYLGLFKMTGISTPPPPRPKHELVARVADAAVVLELAFRVMGRSQGK